MTPQDTRKNTLPAVIAGERSRDTGARAGVFGAQLLGQPGQRRGLKGGAPVIASARDAYLSAEYAGAADRRPAPGLVKIAIV
ncbi:hypothetical protein BH09PSE2_BH09PSE2_26570 [soil metagenome]